MKTLRNLLLVLTSLIATVAFALTPAERILLFGKINPVWQANFLTASSLPAGLTASGGANGTYFNSSGILTSGSAPRFDYDPATLAPRGLLVEEARTNRYLNSQTPAGQTITVSNGTAYTVSFYGTGSIAISGAGTQTITGSGANTLTSYTFTASTTSLVLGTPTGSVTNVQVEAGSFATSRIITAGSAVTRTADVVQFNGVPLAALRGAQGSVAAEVADWPGGTTARIVGYNGYSASLIANANTQASTYNASTNVIAGTPSTGFSGNVARVASTWAASGRTIVFNRGTVSSGSGTFSGITNAYLGGDGGNSNYFDGHIRSVAIWNQRLPNPTLQQKSVIGAPY